MARRRCESKSFSFDVMTLQNLTYVLGSHYCNKLNQSDLVCGLINKFAAEVKLIDNMQNANEVVVPQGWFGGSSGLVAMVG